MFESLFGKKKRSHRHKKNGVAVGSHWRNLQEKGKHSRYFNGYRVETQKQSKSTGKRPDYVGYSKKDPRKRIVGDAKNVKELNKQHVDQVKRYKGHPFYAKKGVLVVRKTTKVPEDIKNYAKRSNITITRMGTRRKKKSFWSW